MESTPTRAIVPEVGAHAALTKVVTEADIVSFAEVSLDTNPVHLDEEFARTTRFGGRIAHGMLAAGLISAVLGTRLPGPGAVYLSQTLSFKGPMRIGDAITATATVKSVRADKPIVTLETVVTNQRCEVVVSGEAVILVPAG
ncbi:MAG: MaoC family dehydratase [Deltaproteobacteria bacterium]|nr:MaoC family dehydratase [Deltaproteobacteria bacterium]